MSVACVGTGHVGEAIVDDFGSGVECPLLGESLLRVHSVSLNFRDVAPVLGRYVQISRPALIPCSDAAAEIVEVGEDVEIYKVGDRVISTFHPRWFGGPPPANWASESYGTWRDGWLTELQRSGE